MATPDIHNPMSRRSWLELCLAALAFVAGYVTGTRRPTDRSDGGPASSHAMLEALLDTLLPDGEYPGYRATNVLPALVARFRLDTSPPRTVKQALESLELFALRTSGNRFVDLSPSQRKTLIAQLDPNEALLRVGIGMIRDEAFQIHYASPIVWQSLAFSHPPQPLGYLDYADAPQFPGFRGSEVPKF